MKKILLLLSACFAMSLYAQSLKHPVIYATSQERQHILDLIQNYDWAKKIEIALHAEVDFKLRAYKNNPNIIFDSIPKFAANSKKNTEFKASPLANKHNRILALASRASMLYYITQDVKYAKFSADLIAPYLEHMASRTPKNTSITGNHFYDPRTTYGPIALTYDFIYNYLKQPNATVYNSKLKTQIPFNNTQAQKAIVNMVGDMLQEYGAEDTHGKIISNHPILKAPGALFGILCVENDEERERLFNVFWEKGTAHQNSFKHTILPMFGKQGIWPESLGYSFMPAVTMVLNIVDRIKPELDVTKDYVNILEGNFLFDNLRHPDRRFVRYGDSKRNKDLTEELYGYTLNLATRRGYKSIALMAQIALKQAYKAKGKRSPKLTDDAFNNYQELQLFWGEPLQEQLGGTIDFEKPTVTIPHAGIVLQRNTVNYNNEAYGLCGIIGGAHYVHSHLTGITMELYGANYIMAPNAGLPERVWQRRIPLHENYFRLYAGNNTVVVNGKSHGIQEGSWKDGAYVWQNTVRNVAAEPKHLKDPVSPNFNFATQLLNDDINKAKQLRTLGIIRTSAKTGYYFDMFRSKALGDNKFHDYIYHNIGDKTVVYGEGNTVLKRSKTKRYQNDIGDPVASPGWRFFEKTKTTASVNEAVKVAFQIKHDNRFMNMFTPKGITRAYTTALAPPTREAKNGYDKIKTQVLTIRQEGEAWNTPFVSVFEPTIGAETSVKNVKRITSQNTDIGLQVESVVNTTKFTDYIICLDTIKTVNIPNLGINFKGHYGIVRIEEKKGEKPIVTLYIGEGSFLKYNTYSLVLETKRQGVQVFK